MDRKLSKLTALICDCRLLLRYLAYEKVVAETDNINEKRQWQLNKSRLAPKHRHPFYLSLIKEFEELKAHTLDKSITASELMRNMIKRIVEVIIKKK